jgi:epoxyqueuosine reductase
MELKAQIKQLAREAGFDLVGVAPAEPLPDCVERFERWLDSGRHAGMNYLSRHRALRADPRALLPSAKSILMLGVSYRTPVGQTSGLFSCYAWGRDYHKVLRGWAKQLLRAVEAHLGRAVESRICVDSAPLLERSYAVRAGLGWIGKNALLIHPHFGSFFFLAAVLWELELPPDESLEEQCGDCRECLDACPTGAFPQPHLVDAGRCISYLTIEHRGDIPSELQPLLGSRIFGCDACQKSCPFNRKAPGATLDDFQVRPAIEEMTLADFAELSEEEFERIFTGSAVRRTGYRAFMRNVNIAMANRHR